MPIVNKGTLAKLCLRDLFLRQDRLAYKSKFVCNEKVLGFYYKYYRAPNKRNLALNIHLSFLCNSEQLSVRILGE